MDWIKLKCNFLQNDKIRLIRAEKNGDAMAFLWVGLLCLAGGQENGGVFRLNGQILSDRALALLLDVSPKLMSRALALFSSFGMVAKDDGAYVSPAGKRINPRRRWRSAGGGIGNGRRRAAPEKKKVLSRRLSQLCHRKIRAQRKRKKKRERKTLSPLPPTGAGESVLSRKRRRRKARTSSGSGRRTPNRRGARRRGGNGGACRPHRSF